MFYEQIKWCWWFYLPLAFEPYLLWDSEKRQLQRRLRRRRCGRVTHESRQRHLRDCYRIVIYLHVLMIPIIEFYSSNSWRGHFKRTPHWSSRASSDTVYCTFTYHTWQFIMFTIFAITACIFSYSLSISFWTQDLALQQILSSLDFFLSYRTDSTDSRAI